MAGPQLNGQPLFYTGIITAVGPYTGMSSLVYPYHPKDPANAEREKRVKHIASNMAAWWHCYWKYSLGYLDSTVTRLTNSFYFDRAVDAPESEWIPDTMEVKQKGKHV